MKRRALLLYLKNHECLLFREGKRHSVFHNIKTNRVSTVPRHNEIDNWLANKICKDLGIPKVKK
ncbi:addiction module toxin, HicA family [Candidatus Azambacteria bacterium RIFOXYD1_FULL_44_10]|nr:MAG: addiction module toxin, HicA family [Candidatus Azambacteria bacterium RIFOXYD1_FULL_44_10]